MINILEMQDRVRKQNKQLTAAVTNALDMRSVPPAEEVAIMLQLATYERLGDIMNLLVMTRLESNGDALKRTGLSWRAFVISTSNPWQMLS